MLVQTRPETKHYIKHTAQAKSFFKNLACDLILTDELDLASKVLSLIEHGIEVEYKRTLSQVRYILIKRGALALASKLTCLIDFKRLPVDKYGKKRLILDYQKDQRTKEDKEDDLVYTSDYLKINGKIFTKRADLVVLILTTIYEHESTSLSTPVIYKLMQRGANKFPSLNKNLDWNTSYSSSLQPKMRVQTNTVIHKLVTSNILRRLEAKPPYTYALYDSHITQLVERLLANI